VCRVVNAPAERRLLEEAVTDAAGKLGLDAEALRLVTSAAAAQAEDLLESVSSERRAYTRALEYRKIAVELERDLVHKLKAQPPRLTPQIIAYFGIASVLYWLVGIPFFPRLADGVKLGLLTLAPLIIGIAGTIYYAFLNRRTRHLARQLDDATVAVKAAESAAAVDANRLTGALLAEVVPGFLATAANSLLRPDYSVELTMTGAVTAFAPEASFYTRTKEAARLTDMLHRMPGGSIGLSGPRGAGKTALIDTFATDIAVVDSDIGPYLSVAVSAPVDYDPREFILHLFATLCERVLTVSGRSYSRESLSQSATRLHSAPSSTLSSRMGIIAAASLVFGSVGLGASWLTVRLGLDVNLLSATAIWAVLFGLAVLVFARSRKPEAIRPQETNALAGRARDLLDGIRFQQTYTAGWGGSLKLPVAETLVKGDLNLARATRTIPELVGEYRRFAADVAAAYGKLLITVDEMDKIRDASGAEAFLNQLKAVFGVPRVFFLVSVSEDALVGFERRGFSRRDVFDSAFDEILSMHHLDWLPARRLAARRVVGLPVPFIGLAYAVSGGLPRDLVRTLRRIADLHRDQPGAVIHEVAHKLCQPELVAKARATALMLQGVASVQRDASAALSDLFLGAESSEEERLRAGVDRLVTAIRSAASSDGEGIPQPVLELSCYGYYCVTLLDFFIDGRDYVTLCPSEMQSSAGTVQELVAALNELARDPALCWQRVSECRERISVKVWDYPLVTQDVGVLRRAVRAAVHREGRSGP
jgi:hypothetical protein